MNKLSRSYRHYGVCKDHTRGMKQVANRIVRRRVKRGELDNLANSPSAYRKAFESYDISDYTFSWRNFENYTGFTGNMRMSDESRHKRLSKNEMREVRRHYYNK